MAFDYRFESITESGFGGRLSFPGLDGRQSVAALESEPRLLTKALAKARGLVVMPCMDAITVDPALLVRLSHLCGPIVENYRETLTTPNLIHPEVPEILVLANITPSNRQPPARPNPPLTENGDLPVQFPQRRGWHTDQSFRRPPPDISLFYAVLPCAKGEGHTMFADGEGAYAALAQDLKVQIDDLKGLHALLATGRSEEAVRNGIEPKPLMDHQRSQAQPVARVHPVTGQRALYLCEAGQMDWLEGPLVGLEPGPEGQGAELLYKLMSHLTQPRFVYAHDWDEGDLVIYDNRCLVHTATWYDVEKSDRIMWRTTVMGNPGETYAGERPSWIPEDDNIGIMQGLEGLKGWTDVKDWERL